MKSIRRRLGVLAPLLASAWLSGLSACGGGDDHTIELENETAPYLVPLARAAVQVSAGWAHTCAVLADGSAAAGAATSSASSATVVRHSRVAPTAPPSAATGRWP
jgi:hypothetical protein